MKTTREQDLLLVETVEQNVNFFHADVVADATVMMMMIRITSLSYESNMIEKSSTGVGIVD